MFALLVGLFAPNLGAEEGIVPRFAQLEEHGGAYHLNADFELALSPSLEQALRRGLPLNFVLELNVWQPRKWWLDKRVTGLRHSRKISFNALTRQYRVETGELHQDYSDLRAAIDELTRVRGYLAVSPGVLRKGQTYAIDVRLSLDAARLPRPIQISAITSADWHLRAQFLSWTLTP